MVVVLKSNWKLVYLVVVAGLLQRTPYGQDTSQVSVVQEDEQNLLNLIQETNFGFEIESNVQEEKEDDQISPSAISLLRPDIEPSEKDLVAPNEENKVSKTVVPESILEFAEFIDEYEPSERPPKKPGDIVAFEMNLQLMAAQKACQKDFQSFGRTSFNAVGIIRISLLDGTEKYCTGTLISDNTIITTAECYQKNAVRFQYQPSWVCETEWLTLKAIYIPDKWLENKKTNNFALYFLENPLNDAPKIGFALGVTQTQQCYITLLGWIYSTSGKEYKMVPCPNLPDVEERLGIESKNCGEFPCNLDDMNFETGSPIILTCPNPIQHTVIGVLHMREDKQARSSVPFLVPKTYPFPYMFNLEDYQDIKEKVMKGFS